jgi:hypothetical protein
MKNSTLLKIVNPLLFIAVLSQFINVLMQKLIIADWVIEMHEIIGYSIGVLVVLHVMLNWAWVRNNLFKKKPANRIQ